MEPLASSLVIPFARVRSWMFDTALPLWAGRGVDREHGGFVERLTLDGRDAAAGFKRTRVTARQTYVFSHAALQGDLAAGEIAAHGWRFLERAWLGDRWARSLTRDGAPLDGTADLYDFAFGLFAAAWYARASGSEAPLDRARATLAFLNKHMRWPDGGFRHDAAGEGPRQQNPHMHLLEALLALYETSPEPLFRELAEEVATLFTTRLFDRASGTLPEFFEPGWLRAPGADGEFSEPGHQLEWAWILARYDMAFNADSRDTIDALVTFAEANGVDADRGAVYNRVSRDRQILDAGSRIWPNTERIKGALGRFERTGRDPRPAVATASRLLLDRYLALLEPGLWTEEFDSAGRPTVGFVPASTFYHLFLAFSELLRLQASLEAAPISPAAP